MIGQDQNRRSAGQSLKAISVFSDMEWKIFADGCENNKMNTHFKIAVGV